MPVISQDFSAVSSVTTLFQEQNNADTNANAETQGTGMFLAPSPNVPMRPSDVTGFFVVAATEEGKLEFNSGDGLLSLEELSDVTITAVADQDYLHYDAATSQWINGQLSLSSLNDVTITAPVAGEVLEYNGVSWVNAASTVTAAGADTEVQFNSGGSLGASPGLVFNVGTNTLSSVNVGITGDLTVLGVSSFGPASTVGFFGAAPVAQQTAAVVAGAFVANTSGIADDTATFDGYTMGQVVAALKAYGMLA